VSCVWATVSVNLIDHLSTTVLVEQLSLLFIGWRYVLREVWSVSIPARWWIGIDCLLYAEKYAGTVIKFVRIRSVICPNTKLRQYNLAVRYN